MEKISLILGLGISGKACADYFEKQKTQYLAYDDCSKNFNSTTFSFMRLLTHEEIQDVHFDILVVSPGINQRHFLYQRALKEKKKITSELQIALEMVSSKVIGITGTNGKTTVTKFIEEGLKKLNFKAVACGNYGVPLLSILEKIDSSTVIVLELSSYQLETISKQCLHFGVILNITQDHLDRYITIENYAQAKFKMIDLIKEDGKIFIQKEIANQFKVSSSPCIEYFDDQSLSIEALEKYGKKEKENWIGAYLILRHFGFSVSNLIDHLQTFQKPHHRIEYVDEVQGVAYYDDSKGTNVDAVIFALEKFEKDVVLLLGGKDKDSDYSPWIEAFKGKVKKICAYGMSKEKIYQALSSNYPIDLCEDLKEATLSAHQFAKKGDVVLLSPGCSSLDQFKDYIHRSTVFKNCVENLHKGKIVEKKE
jgi:UDP-N-acetylmuramoylalanine--D-glutamate ligase